MYTWKTRGDGRVEVNGLILMPDAPNKRLFDARVWRWKDVAKKASSETGVPTHWLLGVTGAESGGNKDAVSSAGAVGLTQVLPRFHLVGVPEAMWTDPLTNMRAGARYLAGMRKKGYDLPRAAAEYNTGHLQKSVSSDWGYYAQGCPPDSGSHTCYITNVVGFANYAADHLDEEDGNFPMGKVLLAGGALAGLVWWLKRK